jgi:peptide-methionine (R)-S-oxide reductase
MSRPRKFQIKRTEEEWARFLKSTEYDVLRSGMIARPWRGEYLKFYPLNGAFACRGCGATLYAADRKFDDASGYCAFDQCFRGRLYCSGVDVSTGEKVWKAKCTGCGCFIARVTRGERRTHRNERHVVSSLSVKYIAGENMMGTMLPPQGPLDISEELLSAETPANILPPSSISFSSTSTSNTSNSTSTTNTSTNSNTNPRPSVKQPKKKQPSIQLSETEKSRGKRGHAERPCTHLLQMLKTMRVFQSLAKIPEHRGHQTCSGLGDVAGTINLPCSDADDKEIPGVSMGFDGCKECRSKHTPMHRCQRFYTWLCLYPGCRSACMCAKYSKKHYSMGVEHCVMLTPGLATWCFSCARFVHDPRLDRMLRQAHLSRFGTLPLMGMPPKGIRNGADILRNKLGYQNAQSCACSLCNPSEKPRKKLPSFVIVPDIPRPPHPSYISLPSAQQGSGSNGNTSELLDRLKGMIIGAALGDALGQLTTGMSHEVVQVIFADLARTKKLNFHHINLRPIRRRPPAKGHKVGEWTPAADLMILGLQSMCAFGGRFEAGDVALRLARYVHEGLTVDDHSRGKKIGTFVKKGAVTPLVSRVIGDDLGEFVQSAPQLAYEAESAYSANPLATSGNEAIFRSFIFATNKFDNIETVVGKVRKACRMTHASTKAVAAALAVGSSIAMMLNGQYTWNSGGDARCKVMQRDAYFAACMDAAMNTHQHEYRRTLLLGIADPPRQGMEDYTSSDEEYENKYHPQTHGADEEDASADDYEYGDCAQRSAPATPAAIIEGYEHEERKEEENNDSPQMSLDFLRLDHATEGSQALKTAAVAFWAQRYPESEYMDAVLEVILQGGDASANGCMAGAIMGLRCGFGKLPTHWLARLRGKDWLAELADKYNILLWEGH